MTPNRLRSLLLQDEARHQKFLVVLAQNSPYFCAEFRGQSLIAIPHRHDLWWLVNPQKSVSEALWEGLQMQVQQAGFALKGRVYLPAELARCFFSSERLQAPFLHLSQGFWVLSDADFTPPTVKVSGFYYRAKPQDVDCTVLLLRKFLIEALPHQRLDESSLVLRVQQKIEKGQIYLWWFDKQPVAMVAEVRRTESVSALSWVYTEPKYRGQGIASRLVGAVSQLLLQKQRMCCLFTDLENPTSGYVYQKLGYVRQEAWLTLDLP